MPQIGWLISNRNLCLTVLEAEQSKVIVSADLVSGEGLFTGSQMALFLLYPLLAKAARELSGVSIIRTLIPFMGGLCPHDLITSQRPHLQIPSHWGNRFQHTNFEGTQIFSLQHLQKLYQEPKTLDKRQLILYHASLIDKECQDPEERLLGQFFRLFLHNTEFQEIILSHLWDVPESPWDKKNCSCLYVLQFKTMWQYFGKTVMVRQTQFCKAEPQLNQPVSVLEGFIGFILFQVFFFFLFLIILLPSYIQSVGFQQGC